MEKEYDTLRTEILQNMNSINNYVAVLYAALGAVFAFVLSQNNPILYISIFVILISISGRIHSLHQSSVKISAYIIVFIESKSQDLKWETRNASFVTNKNRNTYDNNNIIRTIATSNATSFIIGLFALGLFFLSLYHNFSMLVLIIGGLICIISQLILTFFYISGIRINDKRNKYIEYWKHIK